MPTATIVHIFVNQTKVEFDTDQVTGLQIKQRAGVSPDFELARREHGQYEIVGDTQVITIKNGDHFVATPPGTIS